MYKDIQLITKSILWMGNLYAVDSPAIPDSRSCSLSPCRSTHDHDAIHCSWLNLHPVQVVRYNRACSLSWWWCFKVDVPYVCKSRNCSSDCDSATFPGMHWYLQIKDPPFNRQHQNASVHAWLQCHQIQLCKCTIGESLYKRVNHHKDVHDNEK